MPKISLLIFDWDGTLMDSAGHIVESMQYAFSVVDCECPSSDQIRQIIGLGLDEAVLSLAPSLSSCGVDNVVEQYRRHFRQHQQTPTLFDGVREGLRILAASNYRMAVATGKSRAGLQRSMQTSGLASHFESSRCADQCSSKPAPDMVLEILSETGVEPGEALVIGDTSFDLQMATNAGVRSAAVSYGAHAIETLERYEPIFTLDSMMELPAKLEAAEV